MLRLPRDKFDTASVKGFSNLSFKRIKPFLPKLLEWMQDYNWPVAQALEPILIRIGKSLAPQLQSILKTNDGIWKYWILSCIIAKSPPLISELREIIETIANSPTQDEINEEANLIAQEILKSIEKQIS